MKIYKAKIEVELVISAETPASVFEVVMQRVFSKLDGMSLDCTEIKEVNDVSELPKGWTGKDLAFMEKSRKSKDEQSIAWHLENNKTKV